MDVLRPLQQGHVSVESNLIDLILVRHRHTGLEAPPHITIHSKERTLLVPITNELPSRFRDTSHNPHPL